MSRADLAKRTGIGARTLYALEVGESENFGLGNYLKVLDALGLVMSIDLEDPLPASASPSESPTANAVRVPWEDLADRWKLDKGDAQ